MPASAQEIPVETESEPLNICGLVVRCNPRRLDQVVAELEALPGVEIHARDDVGKLVVTAEQTADAPPLKAIDLIERIEGVLSTSLVYHFCDA
ncbi:chaperone NapD [Hahella sp. SMD15-11]|uniref:Chaperone NapD n=1 Tax=Thermohahella caldifontis TaxID=3142973 RepID=A0AB39UX64_9GAMM